MSSLIQPLAFTGVSQYSSDFQAILTRAQQVASIPLQILQNRQSDLQTQQSQAASLGSAVGNLASSLHALGTLGANRALVASSSDATLVNAQTTGATANATYTISNITSVARAASESSLQSYADPNNTAVSSTGSLDLVVGTVHTPISLGAGQNNLVGLENAINASGAGVTAQILTAAQGDYLSVSAQSPGQAAISLVDDPTGAQTQLLTSQNPGANSVFQLNGIDINEPNVNINNVVPGLTFTIGGTTAANQTVTVSLSSNGNQLSSALQNLVSAYNTTAQQVNGQTGTGGGLLTGDPIVWQTRSAMMNLVNYHGTGGSIRSLSDLGITLDATGQMSFDPSKITSLSDSQLSDAFNYLGSATTGLGALQNQFTAISDPVTGSVQALINQDKASNDRLTNQIGDLNDRINLMQTALQSRLAAADALAAQLQSQQSLLTSSIQSLNFSTYGQQTLSQQGL